MTSSLDFEIPIRDLETKIEELRHLPTTANLNIAEEIANLQGKVDKLLRATYGKLTPWQKVQVARHPERPHCRDYIEALFTEFTPLAGDRLFGEDRAIMGGLARFRGVAVMVMGTEKGSDTDERVRHNFGMARPEGYRKVRRLLELAERFRMPVITLVDTAGAFPGADAEARGQAEAIARAIETSVGLTVPLIATIIGEGGSGGAIALATGNSVLMLEHAVYSVISPEGCASILWRGGDQATISAAAASAAEAMRLTAQDLLKLQIIDRIVAEPMGGAHRDRKKMFETLGDAIESALNPLLVRPPGELKRQRREKFLAMGAHGI